MKKIIKSTLWLLCSLCLFTACSDDNDDNPTLRMPESFRLNTPAYANSVTDLATSEEMEFTWAYPQIGFPTLVEYQLQFSKTGQFTKEYDRTLQPEEQSVDYITGEASYPECRATVSAKTIDKMLQQICLWEDGQAPRIFDMYVRAVATIGPNTIYSNIIKVVVAPYYFELVPADPDIWYLVGDCIADGTWGNSEVGKNLIPLYVIEGETYNETDGTGVISYTGYFPTGGQFKLVHIPGDWNEQMNYENVDSPDDKLISDEDGNNHNIGIVNAGYYDIKVNTATKKITIAAHSGDVKKYDTCSLPGGYSSWADGDEALRAMTAIETFDRCENHNWYKDIDFSEDQEVKFLPGGTWLGGTTFPYGAATDGPNLIVPAGKYRLFFNDITKQYMFIAQE
ncbi:MAG: SusE domain-containing protein [Prevotella sp.]|nr:SusE domain-containing protein [Prevotella sp.]